MLFWNQRSNWSKGGGGGSVDSYTKAEVDELLKLKASIDAVVSFREVRIGGTNFLKEYVADNSSGSFGYYGNANRQMVYRGSVHDFTGKRLTKIALPVADDDAANKKYVDDAVKASGGSSGVDLSTNQTIDGEKSFIKPVCIGDTGSLKLGESYIYNLPTGNKTLTFSTWNSTIDFSQSILKNIQTPQDNNDAVNKAYVDNLLKPYIAAIEQLQTEIKKLKSK